jgi:hypothetical protein
MTEYVRRKGETAGYLLEFRNAITIIRFKNFLSRYQQSMEQPPKSIFISAMDNYLE